MILAGDIGGTNTRLAFFKIDNGRFVSAYEHVFPSRQFRGLDEIVVKFVGDAHLVPESACFGIAGPVRHGRVEASNLPWIVDASQLAREVHLESVVLLNDLEAQAWGINCLTDSDTVALNKIKGVAVGNRAVVAAGTGLGEAALLWDGRQYHVVASEGGHADFAPRNEIEIELYRYLAIRFGHVSYERIVSGPGLVNVYMFLRDTHRGQESPWLREEMLAGDPAAAVSRAALTGKSPLAEQALDLMISIYGAEAGNMALKVFALGGVFLAGGIAPKILPKLAGPLFMQAFLSKGRLQSLLESIPVYVITNEKTGLLGAACYAAEKVKMSTNAV